jgi:hypothetical protein
MKPVYSITIETPTALLRARQTFYFSTVEDRSAFMERAKERFGSERVSIGVDMVTTPSEALKLVDHEIKVRQRLASGVEE